MIYRIDNFSYLRDEEFIQWSNSLTKYLFIETTSYEISFINSDVCKTQISFNRTISSSCIQRKFICGNKTLAPFKPCNIQFQLIFRNQYHLCQNRNKHGSIKSYNLIHFIGMIFFIIEHRFSHLNCWFIQH